MAERFTRRKRLLEIATRDDLEAIQAYLEEWLEGLEPGRILRVDAGKQDPGYQGCLNEALDFIEKR